MRAAKRTDRIGARLGGALLCLVLLLGGGAKIRAQAGTGSDEAAAAGLNGAERKTVLSAALKEDALPEEAAFGKGLLKLRGGIATVTLSYGVQGMARYGRTCLVNGTVEAEKAFFGSVRICLTEPDGRTVSYETAVRAEKEIFYNQGTRYQGDFSILLPMQYYGASFTAALYTEDGELLTERELPLSCRMFAGGTVIGVCGGEEAASYSYLSSFGGYVVELSPDELPVQKEGWDFFDVICLDGCEEGRFSDGALRALADWVADGGTLAVGTGARGEETLRVLAAAGLFSGEWLETGEVQMCYGITEEKTRAVNERLLRYEVERSQLLDYLAQVEQSSGVSADGSVLFPEGGGVSAEQAANTLYAAEAARLCRFAVEDGVVAVADGEDPVLTVSSFGQGTVEWFGVSLHRRPQDYYGLYFAFLLQEYEGKAARTAYEERLYGGGSYEVLSALNLLRRETVPPFGRYVLLLFGYLCLGVLLWYVLAKRKGKRRAVFPALSALAVVFLLIGYALGGGTRITKPYVTYVEVVTQTKEAAKGSLTFAAAAPTGGTWSLAFPGTTAIEIDPFFYCSAYDLWYLSETMPWQREEQELLVREDAEETVFTVSGAAPFSEVFASFSYPLQERVSLAGEFFLTEQGLSGLLTNESTLDFAESYLYADGVLVEVAGLAPGETVVLEDREQTFLAGGYRNVEELSMLRTEEGSAGALLSRSYVSDALAGKLGESCFVGITEEASAQNPAAAPVGGETDGGVTMWVLSMETDAQGFRLLEDRTMRVLEGEYEPGSRFRAFSSETLVAEYRFSEEPPAELRLDAFYNRDYDPYNACGFRGSVFLYCWETGEYELLSDGGEAVLPAARYLSADGGVRVRFVKDALYQDYGMELPYLSYRTERQEGHD